MPESQLVGVPTGPNLEQSKSNPLREAREQLEQAESLRRQRKFDRAESACTALLRRHPDYFGAHHTLGLIHADRGDYRRAIGPLVQAAMLNPRSWSTHTALAGVYLRLDAKEMAAHTLEQARAIKPNEPSILVTLGEVYREEREYELARDVFQEALAAEPGMEEAAIGLSAAFTSLGEHARAADAIEPLLKRAEPSLGALMALLALPSAAIRRDVMADLERVAATEGTSQGQYDVMLAFAKATALDKAKCYAEAWKQAVIANRLVSPSVKNDLATQVMERQIRLKWLRDNSIRAKASPAGETWPISLFILGSSRSGKTSTEGLVATLDGVKRGYENPSVENAISRAYQEAGLITGYWLGYLPPQFHSKVSEIYAEELARRGAASAKIFTNTHPAHISNAAHLAMILPNTRFLFVKRNVEDLALRIFLQQYERGNPYAYDLSSIRAHVAWYHQMMDILAQKLPNITRIVHYEDIVSDPARALRVAAELCGQPTSDKPLRTIGDDRGCAEPYREFMNAELS